MITVFTPTFNRAYIIVNLYNSLKRQTFADFEWLIVDDGSSDNTQELVQSFINESKIHIRYYKQINGGKHRAINNGIKLAKGELFFIVDSDDYLADNALEKMNYYWLQVKDREKIAGVVGLRAYTDGKAVGHEVSYDILECSCLDYTYRYRLVEESAEAYKTAILRQYPFPEFEGENYIAPSVVWNRISQKYQLLYFAEKIYFMEYMPDGLTKNAVKTRIKNPIGATFVYQQLIHSNIPFFFKLKSAISYWRYSFYVKQKSFMSKIKEVGFWSSIIAFLPGLVLYFNDKK
jgi:glycosyltransferase involved in cell wall biosynthesis